MSVSSPTGMKPMLGQELSYQGRQNRLYNTMIDVALVYGIDETTCRSLDINDKENVQEVYSSLLERDLKLRFLQILAPGQVYPTRTSKTASPGAVDPNVETDNPHSNIQQRRKFRIEDVGLVWETVDTLHMFMYPDGVQLHADSIEPSMLPLMLTNIEANRSYAVGLKFTRPFFIEPVDNGHYKLTPWTFSGGPKSQCKLIYLPTCVVLVSAQPLYNFMKETLSGLYRLVSVNDVDIDFWEVLQDFAEKIFLLPTVPQGTTGIEVTLPGFSSVSRIMPPRQNLYLDVRMDFPFRFLSVDDVLTVVAAILSEQRILVFSSHYTIPGIFIQCILSYILPFEFRHPIVSILPKDQLELLGAVGTNIMGCHSSALATPEFAEVEEGVLVYLDEGKVELRLSPDFPLHLLPSSPMERFKLQYQNLTTTMNYDIESLERLTLGSATERENTRFYFHHYYDTKLLDLFLELMVRIFSDITEDLKQSRTVFETNIKKLSEKDQQFYRQITQSDMYSVFLIQQRHRQRDCFNILADQIKLNCKKNSIQDDEFVDIPSTKEGRRLSVRMLSTVTSSTRYMTPRGSIVRGTITSSSSIEDRVTPPLSACLHGKNHFYQNLQFLEMPRFEEGPLNRSKYINETLKVLQFLSQDKENKAVCTYLSAYYKIANGDVLEGLDEFYEILQRLNTKLVPSPSDMVEFVGLLNQEERKIVSEKSYYKQFLPRGVSRSVAGRHMTQMNLSRPTATGGKVLKRRPMNNNSFLTEVQHESIARDAESANNLFSVLQIVGQSATIPPDLFQQFVDSWAQVLKENERLANEVNLIPCSADVNERVLASQNDLKCNLTQHCTVVLTTHRIIILSQAGWRERTFANLFELELGSFSKCEIAFYILGGKTPAIRQEVVPDKRDSTPSISISRTKLRRNQKSDPYLAFSDELVREVWYHMIKEVISGWKIIFNRRDPSVMDEVECHVKMAMALYGTGWMHSHGSNTNSRMLQKLLSYHSKPITDSAQTAEAVDALQYRINPNIHQTEKATIESTLFVPSEICGGQGKLMLGMGSGMLRVYDIEAHCFESDLKIFDSRRRVSTRITCLLLVDLHVWVGRLGKTIHILDVETLCQVSQLPYLDDDPRDMCLSKCEPKMVWTLLLNGCILGFDPETRERIAKIEVPGIDQHSVCSCFTVWKEYLWVGTNKGVISILNTQKLAFEDGIRFPVSDKVQVEIKCLALSSEDEIWCSIYAVPRGPDSMYVAVFNPRLKSNTRDLFRYSYPDRISYILPFKDTVWCGTKSGKILVFSAKTENNRDGPKILSAHDDKIRSMAATDTDFIISGTGSNDGYANVWKLNNDWFNNK